MSLESLFRRLERLETVASLLPSLEEQTLRERLASMSDAELEEYRLSLELEKAEIEGNQAKADYCRRWKDVSQDELIKRFLLLEDHPAADSADYRNLKINHIQRGHIYADTLRQMRAFVAQCYGRCHQPQGKTGRSTDFLYGNGTGALFEMLTRQNGLVFGLTFPTSADSHRKRNFPLLQKRARAQRTGMTCFLLCGW